MSCFFVGVGEHRSTGGYENSYRQNHRVSYSEFTQALPLAADITVCHYAGSYPYSFVRETLPQSVGKYIAIMKVRSLQEIRALNTGITDVFSPGFHDRRLRRCHKLKAIIEYIQKNPYRLLVRRYNPEYFKKINNIEIGGKLWQAYGNMQLLDNPFKGPVVIHRSDSEALVMAKWGRWRHLAENGGVLVSPFISQHEKMVRGMCEKVDGKVILLVNKPFGEREKPAAHDFELCAKGKLLILAPMTELPSGRETFLYLNSIAETIALPREG